MDRNILFLAAKLPVMLLGLVAFAATLALLLCQFGMAG